MPETLKRIAGVDDAGRGPVIGPLVIAGALFLEGQAEQLKELGVKDSKLLTPSARSRLAKEIRRLAINWHHVEILPSEVDDYVRFGRRLYRLNFLEAKKMAEVIAVLQPDEAYVDASDVDPLRFGEQIRSFLKSDLRILSTHHADSTIVEVSAASILAKVQRDAAIAKLREEHGDFGSGYPSDPRTRSFLLDWRREHGHYPQFVRKSWKTLLRLEETIAQKTLI